MQLISNRLPLATLLPELNQQVKDLIHVADQIKGLDLNREKNTTYPEVLWQLGLVHCLLTDLDPNRHEQYTKLDMRLQEEYECLDAERKEIDIDTLVYDFLQLADDETIAQIDRERMFHDLIEAFRMLEWMGVAEEYSKAITDAEKVVKAFPEHYALFAPLAKQALKEGLGDSHIEDLLTLIASSPEAEVKELKVTLTTEEINTIFAEAEGE